MEKYNNTVPIDSFQDCIIDNKLQTQKLNFPNFRVHVTDEACTLWLFLIMLYFCLHLQINSFYYFLFFCYCDSNVVFVFDTFPLFLEIPYLAYLSGRKSEIRTERKPLRDLLWWLARKLYFSSSFCCSTSFVVWMEIALRNAFTQR